MTHFLKNSLGGSSKTVLIGNIWPCEKNIGNTLKTLRFAKRLKNIKISLLDRKEYDKSLSKAVQNKMQVLEEELIMHDEIYNSKHVDNIFVSTNSGYYVQCERQVRSYLNGKAERITFKSVAEVHIIFSIFKKLFHKSTRS